MKPDGAFTWISRGTREKLLRPRENNNMCIGDYQLDSTVPSSVRQLLVAHCHVCVKVCSLSVAAVELLK